MKSFFKTFFASTLGALFALFIFGLISFGIVSAVIGGIQSKEQVNVKENSYLVFKLNYPIQDHNNDVTITTNGDLEELFDDPKPDLPAILKTLKHAASDDRIKGLFLDIDPAFSSGFANLKELHDAILAFRDSGKYVVAYSEFLSESGYYLASASNKIVINPSGEMLFNGFRTEIMFFKDALAKLGIEMQPFKVGKFKSAVEPYLQSEMSEPSKEQTRRYLESLLKTYLTDLSKDRGIGVPKLREISDKLEIRHVSDAKRLGMVDMIGYEDQALSLMEEQIKTEDKKANSLKFESYYSTVPKLASSLKDRVAVIYAEGVIQSGGSDGMPSKAIIKKIRELKKDKKVKAVVLRINSPGGSALESDLIYRELQLLADSMPLVVSMGNVAASGGYFIACPADYIYAHKNSITGSIGVFALIPNAQEMFNDKLGIHFDGESTGEYSGLGSINRPVTEAEAMVFQRIVDSTYEDFLKKVMMSRKMTREEVHAIAQGRVWTGEDAKGIKLIDDFGGLKEALAKAAELAELEDYDVVEYPETKSFMESLFGSKIEETKAKALREELGPAYRVFQTYKQAMQMRGVQMRMPYDINIQ